MSKRPTIGEQEWGHTPWEDMTPEEHLRETQRLYAACDAMRCALKVIRVGQEGHPFFGPSGTAGRAIAMGDAAMEPYDDGGPVRESLYRSFYRYALDLLFSPSVGFGWYIHEACGQMIGTYMNGEAPAECFLCAQKGKPSTPMRPITWADMRPLSAGKKGSKAR